MPPLAIIAAAIPIIAEAIKAGRTILTIDDLSPEELERIRSDARRTHQEFDAYVASRKAARDIRT